MTISKLVKIQPQIPFYVPVGALKHKASCLNAKSARECKTLGKKVAGFVHSEWENNAPTIAEKGLREKFCQNGELKELGSAMNIAHKTVEETMFCPLLVILQQSVHSVCCFYSLKIPLFLKQHSPVCDQELISPLCWSVLLRHWEVLWGFV